ncbi:MAG: hypothetical protein K0R54_1609 [Clostridiaceae bacterium]|nr:hypothetical protein [Clostridiaceae bacterium]
MGSDKARTENKKSGVKTSTKWIITAIMWSILFSGSASLFSDVLLNKVNLLVAIILLILVILTGIIFDIIGIAVTSADEVPFHAMASKKIKGSKVAIRLIRNAEKVSSFCNDVIGDVCGIISGSIGFIIVNKVLLLFHNINATIVSTLVGIVITSMTVGGKAIGKGFAINSSNNIIMKVSKIINFFKKG